MEKAPCGFAKINFDAIFSNDKVGYGVIIRDSDGFMLRGNGGFKENIIDQDRIIGGLRRGWDDSVAVLDRQREKGIKTAVSRDLLDKSHDVTRITSEALEQYKLRSNQILHAQATLEPSDVSQVNFGCMRQLTYVYLGFNVMNPSSTDSDKKANDKREEDVKESVDPPTREND
ncbi:hypothetical protein Goshw_011610 [Gossypium schwendimanii]|uniref:RNase H type-1 domain-containing protein n=1 Tax=Gossypium schwendimanii TaxID=34291 RepID=A0A7J9M2P6_GOSSC|nr:hypothetical protein [Gossypium schwendimanii]